MARGWKILLWLVLMLVAAVAALPWWLGLALKPILRAHRITFERYERVGYDRFKLLHVQYSHPSVTVQADEVISDTPLLWSLKRLRRAEPVISVGRWRLQVIHNAQPSPGPRTVNGMADLQPLLIRLVPILHRWLPRVELGAGELRGFTPELTLARGTWDTSGLRVDELRGLAGQNLNVVVATTNENNFSVDANSVAKDVHLRFVWLPAEITAAGTWWNQPVKADAHYAAQGWLPADATIAAENWQLPASRVKLGVPYDRVLGSGSLVWRDGTFEISFKGKAVPDEKTKAPPFDVDAAARGNFQEITLSALHVNVPFANASLSAPVTFSVAHPLAAKAAELSLKVNLEKFPWLRSAGKAEGRIKVSPDTVSARQVFDLDFSDITLDGLALQKGTVRGTLEWPLLTLEKLEVQLDKMSYVKVQGAIDWQTRLIRGGTLEGKAGSYWLGRWLPNNVNWTAIEVSAQVQGPLDAPEHHGSFQLTQIKLPALRPINASVTWSGTGRKMEIQSARAVANESSVEFAGTVEPQHLLLSKVIFSPMGGQPVWQLPAPAQITWGVAWRVDNLQLGGERSHLKFKGEGGPDGFVEINATAFDAAWLQDWIAVSGPRWRIHSLKGHGKAERGVLAFETELTAQIDMQPRPAELRLVASGDAGGVQLKELTVVEAERELTRASGRLPFSWRVYPNAEFQLSETEPFELTAATDPDSPLWAALADYTGLTLTRPQAKIDLKGTLRAPAGEVRAQVAQLGLREDRFNFSLPVFDDLTLAMTLERNKLTLANLAAKVDGQALAASGQIPMDDDRWQQVFSEPAKLDWALATARVDMPDADLAALSAHMPNLIAPKGRLRARVELKAGAKLSGELHLNDATARPLPPFSTLQEINADLTLDDRVLRVQKLTAKLGGQPVAIDGSVTLVPGASPRLALGIKGNNLPLVRNTGLLIRNDIDLRAETDTGGVTRVSGIITLRDCLALANVGALLPNGQRGVTRQPPYFSVDAEPFRTWPLAIEVRGQRAIKIRTTVFNGTASARFQLGGTLGEPRAVGEITVDTGQVLFPFATFTVQSGAVRLREADPFHAVLNLSATAQRRDYQLRLEATGQLPSPNIVMSSTPALEAEDVVLMVMTGQPPNNTDVTVSSAGQRLALLGAYLGRGIFQDLGLGGEDRLEITAGEQVSLQGRETYEFEYKLGRRWSLTGEYDRFDSYNAGVKWRAYTQESKPVEKK